MIDILFVITRLAVGGAPQNVLATLRGLDRSRYRITVVTGPPRPEEGSLVEAAKAQGVTLHVLPYLVREIHPLYDAMAFAGLYRMMRRGRYQIVHTHLSKAGIVGRLAASCAGIPGIVHTYHGDVFERYFGSFKSEVLLGVERLVGRVTHRFAVVSEALRARYRAYRVGKSHLFRTVPNGVWPDAFPYSHPGGGQQCRVGTVSMFYPIKRVDLFLEMARQILRIRPDAEFVVAGGGTGEAELREAARDLGDRIRFLGVRYDVPDLLASFDVFVLCSDYEGAGVGLIEAMLSGVPVVATRVGGVPEVVDDGETGFLVPQGNVDALTERVLYLMGNPELRNRMGKTGRRVALRRFSAEAMVGRLDVLYREVLTEARAR